MVKVLPLARRNERLLWIAGRYYGVESSLVVGSLSTAALVAGRLYAIPLLVPEGGATIDRIGIEVTTAGAAGTSLRFGACRSLGAAPDALLFDAGTVAADTIGGKEIVVAQSLPSGWVYLLIHGDGAPVVRTAGATLSANRGTATLGSSVTRSMPYRDVAYGPLPATFGVPTNDDLTTIPRVQVRAV